MERRIGLRMMICALAAVLTLARVVPTGAQTQGMERRDDRRDTRAGARAGKQACKAGDEKTRAECRHVKRDVKQNARHGNDKAPEANPAQ